MPETQVILIVEPLREIREMKARVLEREGFGVAAVGSLAAARARLDDAGVALVLLDLPDSPTMWTTLDSFLSRYLMVPVIVMQGSPCLENAVEAMKRGATDYLAKSLDPTVLQRSVRAALKDRSAGGMNRSGFSGGWFS